MPPSTTAKTIVLAIGLAGGFSFGLWAMSDYQLVKKLPPLEVELNEDGTPKSLPFRVSFKETEPLTLKPEVLARREKEKQKYLEELNRQEALKNAASVSNSIETKELSLSNSIDKPDFKAAVSSNTEQKKKWWLF